MSETLPINGLGRVTDDANLLCAEPRRPLGSQAPYQSAGFGKQYRHAD
jgi:hypothetical protein